MGRPRHRRDDHHTLSNLPACHRFGRAFTCLVMMEGSRGTKEMITSCLLYLHVISLVAISTSAVRQCRGTKEMMQPLSNLPTSHIFGCAFTGHDGGHSRH